MSDDSSVTTVHREQLALYVVRRAAPIGDISLDDILSSLRTLLLSDYPLPQRPHLSVVGTEAAPKRNFAKQSKAWSAAVAQTTRLPIKS